MQVSPAFIGLGSGLVAAVLIASVANGSPLALFLFYVIPLPLFLAGAGWGVGAATLSLIVSFIALSLLNDLTSAFYFIIYMGAPAVVLLYLLHLRRVYETPPADSATNPQADAKAALTVEWYPFGRIIAWTTIMAGGLASFGLLLISAGDMNYYSQVIREIFSDSAIERLQEQFGSTQSAEEMRQQILYLLPIGAAQVWLILMTLNLWLAVKIAAISELLPRPTPSLRAIEYPPFMVAGFFAALVLSFAPGIVGLLGGAFTGAMGLAFVLLGLTVMHTLLANSPVRILALSVIYASLLLYPISILTAPMLLGLGIAEPFLRLRQKKTQQTQPPSDHSERD
ncbi:MAG: YybS family protein [Hyphomicrobiales bacterium]|nr:YybS family protein [Hyphomicrobiales bacterium]